MRLLLCVVLLLTGTAQAAEFCVGRTASSTHRRLADALVAAAANGPGEDLIRLDSNYTHAVPDTVRIATHSVVIAGGYPDCLPGAPNGVSTLSGAGGSAGSVLEIGSGTIPVRVTLRRVAITGGESDGAGGGLHLVGSSLTPNTTLVTIEQGSSVHGNTATLGGGIFVDNATLALGPGTRIQSNTAVDGGGVYCRGNAAGSTIAANGNSVLGNQASGNGGGYVLYGSCSLQASGGSATSVASNHAGRDGGGIYLGSPPASVEARRGPLGGTAAVPDKDAFHIASNVARERGGGVALANGTYFLGTGIVIQHNTVNGSTQRPTSGGGVYVGENSTFRLRHDPHCPPGEPCNRVDYNISASNQAAFGAGVAGDGCAIIDIGNARISNNQNQSLRSGGVAVSALRCGLLELRNAVVHGNIATAASSALYLYGTHSVLDHLTIAGNRLPHGSTVIWATSAPYYSDLTLRSSIIHEPAIPTATLSGLLFQSVDCVLADDLYTYFPAAQRSLQGTPIFVDAAQHNYRARLGAPHIDFCDGPTDSTRDLDGRPRPRDVQNTNLFGSYDIGAYELQPLIFVPPPL